MRMCNLSGVLFMLVAYFAPSPPYLSVVTKSILGGKHLYWLCQCDGAWWLPLSGLGLHGYLHTLLEAHFLSSTIPKAKQNRLWPNRIASRHKSSTCVYLRLHLDRPCLTWIDLRILVRKFASLFSLSTQLSSQIQLVPACDYLQVCLARV